MDQYISEAVVTGITLATSPIRVALPVSGRGLLYQLAVKQTGGALDGFSIKVFSARSACRVNYPETVDAVDPIADDDVYVVVDATAASAGLALFRSDVGRPYTSPDNSIRERIEELQLEITVTSPGLTKTFDARAVYESAG